MVTNIAYASSSHAKQKKREYYQQVLEAKYLVKTRRNWEGLLERTIKHAEVVKKEIADLQELLDATDNIEKMLPFCKKDRKAYFAHIDACDKLANLVEYHKDKIHPHLFYALDIPHTKKYEEVMSLAIDKYNKCMNQNRDAEPLPVFAGAVVRAALLLGYSSESVNVRAVATKFKTSPSDAGKFYREIKKQDAPTTPAGIIPAEIRPPSPLENELEIRLKTPEILPTEHNDSSAFGKPSETNNVNQSLFECPACGTSFEGNLPNCPGCGVEFEENYVEDCFRNLEKVQELLLCRKGTDE